MQEALRNFSGTMSINGRDISNLRFADDTDLIAETEEELQELTTTLERRARAYGMEISAEKSKIMVNSIAPGSIILMNGERLEEVKSFKYLGSIISSEGDSTEEIRTRINLATSAIAKLKKIWSNNNIKTSTKIRLYKSRTTRTAFGQSKTPKTPMVWSYNQTQNTCQTNTTRHGQRRQKTRKTTKNMDNIREWTGLEPHELCDAAQNRPRWRKISVETSKRAPLRSARSRDDE